MTSRPKQLQLRPLLTKKETARDFYAVTERTIDRWLRDGTLPAEAKVVIGGSVRFRTKVLLDHAIGDLTKGNEEGGAT